MAWAAPFGEDRRWAVESTDGLGKLLAQQLLGAGEHIVDVSPNLSARVQLLGSASAAKFRRMWDLYLCYCEAAFLERHVSDVQVVLAKPAGGGGGRRESRTN